MKDAGVCTLTTLAYASRSLIDPRSVEMLDIVRACLRNNPRLGITGALVYTGRDFFQVIEGPDEAVEALWDAIRADPRHCDVRLLLEAPASARRFAGWDMRMIDGVIDRTLAARFGYETLCAAPATEIEARVASLARL